MVPGEPVVRSKLSDFGEKVTIADAIDPTNRAMAIRVNDVSGVAGFVTPGDRVDVLLTRRLDNSNMVTTTVLQDIVVRGIDQLADQDRDQPNVARTVTVEVSPDEAQRLALAQQAGTLGLTLRNLATTARPDLRALSVHELTSTPTRSKNTRAAPTVTIIRAGERSAETVRGG
jgi:pilus assembly protein CpaB